jgi:hypothetical protein
MRLGEIDARASALAGANNLQAGNLRDQEFCLSSFGTMTQKPFDQSALFGGGSSLTYWRHF